MKTKTCYIRGGENKNLLYPSIQTWLKNPQGMKIIGLGKIQTGHFTENVQGGVEL